MPQFLRFLRDLPSWLTRGTVPWFFLTVFAIVGLLNLYAAWRWAPLLHFDTDFHIDDKYRDSLHLAVELGRLDVISALLGLVALALGIFGIIGFGYIRYRSDEVARTTASEVAQEVANRYFQERGLEESDRGVSSPADSTVGEVDVSTSELENEEANSNDS